VNKAVVVSDDHPALLLMDEAETDVLAYMAFPAAHRAKPHSVNPLERLNGEIKWRTDVVGIFPHEAAITAWSAPCCSSSPTNGRSSVCAESVIT
jgi:hypothetical protein